MRLDRNESNDFRISQIDQLTSSTYKLLALFCFVRHISELKSACAKILIIPGQLETNAEALFYMEYACMHASTTTAVPWSISNGHTILTAVELPYDC